MGLGAGRASLAGAAFALAFTVLDLLFIVFLNDWGDREVDAIKRRMFPRGGSPKTIPDRILPARHLLAAGLAAGAGALGVAWAAEVTLDRPGLTLASLFSLGIFVAYTLPPLRLNYRGGGELLEMLGVGVVLPWLSAYLQGGELFARGMWLLPGFAILSLASAIASGLSDERSDREGGKRTFVTTFGNALARRGVEALLVLGALAWVAPALAGLLPLWLAAPPAALALAHWVPLRRASSAAVTDAFDAQKRYKLHLHHAIWRGAQLAAAALAFHHLWLGR
ncbi:MAG: prenyltransferase [Sandaracinaceae bacterium]|nr:prenyltransferase [Sandaracinaceae bacterium]